MRTSLLCAGLVCLALPASSSAATPAMLPKVTRSLRAAEGHCATTAWRAPISGFVSARTSASDRSDWDLDLVDARSRTVLAASHGYGSHEVAQSWVTPGQRVLVRGCRRDGRAKRLGVSLQLVDVTPPEPGAGPSLVTVRMRDGGDVARMENAGLDVTENIQGNRADVVVAGAKQLDKLRTLGLTSTTRVADLNAADRRARAADLRYAAATDRSALPSGRTEYRVLQDYQDELKKLVAQNPGVARPVVLPEKSFQGRELMGIEIANDVGAKDDGRPTYFVMGMHHAREWPSAEAALEFAYLLLQGNGHQARITDLLRRERIVIVPIVNPDGFVESREAAFDPADASGQSALQTVEGVALLGGSFAYRRKNCDGAVPSGDFPCTLQWGVDINRNYGNAWGGPGAGSDPITQSYRGTGPFSEPESRAVAAFTRTRQVTNLISLHNVAALVLRPPGLHDGGLAPDEQAMKSYGDRMAADTGYTSQYSWQLYDTSGTTEDYTYAAQGGYGYTIEIGPEGGQFHMPYQTGVVDQWTGAPGTPQAGRGLRDALLVGAEAAANPSDHAVLTGRAAPGNVLKLVKSFKTETSEVCQYAQGYLNSSGGGTPLDCPSRGAKSSFDDRIEATTVVPPSGTFTWHVNPSTRPFVGWKYVLGQLHDLGGPQTFTPDGTESPTPRAVVEQVSPDDDSASSVDREFTLSDADAAATDVLDVKLNWDTPEDYDLKLFKLGADGSRTLVGSGSSGPGYSGNTPGTPEEVTVVDPQPGKYVLHVIYYVAPGNDWRATVQRQYRDPDRVDATGRTEAYMLLCETADGTVLGRRSVTVARGQRLAVDVPGCARADSASGGGSSRAGTTPAGSRPGPGSAPSRRAARLAARGVSIRVAPRRDRRKPYRFTVSGRVLLPKGIRRQAACDGGKVLVTVRRGKRSVARKRTPVDFLCRFRT